MQYMGEFRGELIGSDSFNLVHHLLNKFVCNKLSNYSKKTRQ